MESPIVVKLGGTSQCAIGYKNILEYAQKNSTNKLIVIVLSAVSGVTNLLNEFTKTKNFEILGFVMEKYFALMKDLDLELCDSELDYSLKLLYEKCKQFELCDDEDSINLRSQIIGFGELLSTRVLKLYFDANDFASEHVDAQKFIINKKESFKIYPTSEFFGDKKAFATLTQYSPNVIITQGFIGSTPSGKSVLLGRGGSDTTGSIIANMLDAQEYQVWTDVNGIYNCDPKIIIEAKKVSAISYKLVQELSSMGAKVMHPLSIYPCELKSIPIKVKNTFSLENETIISNEDSTDLNDSNTFIAIQKNITLFKIESLDMWAGYGFVGDIFEKFTRHRVDVNIVTTSQFQICTTTDSTDVFTLKELDLELSEKYDVKMIKNCEIVSIVSKNAKKFLNKIDLSQIDSHLIHVGANFMTINFVINKENTKELVRYFYDKLPNN